MIGFVAHKLYPSWTHLTTDYRRLSQPSFAKKKNSYEIQKSLLYSRESKLLFNKNISIFKQYGKAVLPE